MQTTVWLFLLSLFSSQSSFSEEAVCLGSDIPLSKYPPKVIFLGGIREVPLQLTCPTSNPSLEKITLQPCHSLNPSHAKNRPQQCSEICPLFTDVSANPVWLSEPQLSQTPVVFRGSCHPINSQTASAQSGSFWLSFHWHILKSNNLVISPQLIKQLWKYTNDGWNRQSPKDFSN